MNENALIKHFFYQQVFFKPKGSIEVHYLVIGNRQVSVGDQVTEGQWGEELMDPEGRLAALMAQITAQQARAPHPQQQHHKVTTLNNLLPSFVYQSYDFIGTFVFINNIS